MDFPRMAGTLARGAAIVVAVVVGHVPSLRVCRGRMGEQSGPQILEYLRAYRLPIEAVTDMAILACSIEDCEAPTLARGWCRKHYKRWYKHGDPLHVAEWTAPPQNQPKFSGCTETGCEEKHFAKGLCHNHYSARDYAINHEARKLTQAKYREANRDWHRERTEQWRQDNPGRADIANRAWYVKNRQQQLEYRRAYRAANPEKVRAHNDKRRMLLQGIDVIDLTPQQWEQIKEGWDHRCAYCGETPAALTKDHIIPISKGGHHTAANIVPACQPCNSRKGDREAPPFYYELTAI